MFKQSNGVVRLGAIHFDLCTGYAPECELKTAPVWAFGTKKKMMKSLCKYDFLYLYKEDYF